jgi:hypothetical protein
MGAAAGARPADDAAAVPDRGDDGDGATASDAAAADLGRASRGGLCAACRHARLVRGARASLFLRCDHEDLPRYPPMPVIACDGFALRPSA